MTCRRSRGGGQDAGGGTRLPTAVTYAFKRAADRLPTGLQAWLRGLHHARQHRRGRFAPDDPEVALLEEWVRPGDTVLDIGANVGRWAAVLAEAVGGAGRVLAFEPVPFTFSLLRRNARRFHHPNVVPVEAAVSDTTGFVSMTVPSAAFGRNYYEARITEGAASRTVLALRLDDLALDARVSLVKVDVEGHEPAVLRGAMELLGRDRPTLIVEASSDAIPRLLRPLGYEASRIRGSPNLVFRADREGEGVPTRGGGGTGRPHVS